MTKLELEKRVAELEKELKEMPDTEKLEKRNQELIQEVYDNRKKFEETRAELETQKETHAFLSRKFNDLAKLFEEYTKASEDAIEINKLFLRNTLRTQELLNAKIKAFNGEGDKK